MSPGPKIWRKQVTRRERQEERGFVTRLCGSRTDLNSDSFEEIFCLPYSRCEVCWGFCSFHRMQLKQGENKKNDRELACRLTPPAQ